MKQRLMWCGIVVWVAGGLVGCGGVPDWVEQGSAALHQDEDQAIYGVGSIVGVKNEPLAWDAAENRARAEIAKTFQTYTAYLMEDYATSRTSGNFTDSAEEQNLKRAIKTFVSTTLKGVRPMDRYKDEDNETYYVLAKLSLEEMKDMFEQSKELNPQTQEFVRENAERAFERLREEEARRR